MHDEKQTIKTHYFSKNLKKKTRKKFKKNSREIIRKAGKVLKEKLQFLYKNFDAPSKF